MSSITVPNLQAAIALVGTEELYAIQNNTAVRVTATQLSSFGNSIVSGPAILAYLAALPTSLPATSGQLWWNGGVLSLS